MTPKSRSGSNAPRHGLALLIRVFTVGSLKASPMLFCAVALAFTIPSDAVHAQIIVNSNQPPRLSVLSSGPNGWLRVGGEFQDVTLPPQVLTLEVSSNLVHWRRAAVLLQAPFRYDDPTWTDFDPRFYRLALTDRTETNDWANVIALPSHTLLQQADCDASVPLVWAKFAIVLAESHRVYFQDSRKHLLHYDFAVNRLLPFRGMTPEQFNAVSLHQQNQQVILGAVVSPYDSFVQHSAGQEYGIQFVGLDPYPPEWVATLFELVRSTINTGPNSRVFYLPTFEQAESAQENETYFAARGIEISSVARWTQGISACYSPGWALGRLKFIPAAEINAAYADGRLGPDDILLTDGVPSEVPFVAGIISLVPATPNSHVAILAQSYGVPFVYLADAAEQQRARALAGREVMLRTGARLSDCQIELLDVESHLNPALKDAIFALKDPGELQITPRESYGAIAASTTNLLPADIRYFGGKASNFGLLRRTIPDYSPVAIAFSFDLWDAFLNQTLPGGQTLRAAIQTQLGGHAYPPNMASLRANLKIVRDLITKTATFTPAQQQAILNALEGFDSNRNIRFRSSTNVEDSEQFTGAGLYDSFSGCLADDLDGDNSGPSHCDPTENEERGVFRAIQKVYASFYNDNAFLERLRFGVNEADVGMALLVHHSTPDPFEMANGVATLTVRRLGNTWSSTGKLVTQLGAVSVANPDSSARPEVVEFSVSSLFTNATFKEASGLVPLGTQVMTWPADYRTLAGLLGTVAVAYTQFDTNRTVFQLDFEYKKVLPGQLRVKQVREIPLPDATNQIPTFLLSKPMECCIVGDPFAVHRLKSRWRLVTTNLALTGTNLAATFYSSAHIEYAEGPALRMLDGSPGTWPNSSHSLTNGINSWKLLDGWSVGTGMSRRDFTLETEIPRTVSPMESPLLTLADARLQCTVDYATPVPAPGLNGATILTSRETVELFRFAWSSVTNLPVHHLLITNGLTISTTQSVAAVHADVSPAHPVNPDCIFIAPKSSYSYVGVGGETRIDGLVGQPLVLHGDFSQTYLKRGRLGHEDFEELICDPWLEAGLSPERQAELTAANIRLLYLRRSGFGGRIETEEIRILGLDGVFRSIP